MLERLQTNERTWIHIVNPDENAIQTVADQYGLHLQTAEEMLSENVSGKADLFENYLYLVLRFPAFTNGSVSDVEVDCVVTENALISVSYVDIPAIEDLQAEVEANSINHGSLPGDHAGYLLYFLLKKLYRAVHNHLLVRERKLKKLEDDVFAGNHRDMVTTLSELSREFVDTRQILSRHEFVLPSLEAAGRELFGDGFQYRLRRIQGEYDKTTRKLDQLKETLGEIRHTNSSLLATRQNEVMKLFTIMAFLTFPLSLLSSIFGMETDMMPIVGHPYDFWIIVGTMFVLVIIALVYFRYKKWI